MRFYTLVLRNLFRRRVRSTLTMTGLAVAVGAVVALVGISDGFERSFLELYERRGVDLIATGTSVERMNTTVDEAIGDKIAQLDGVEAVASGLLDVVSFEKLGIYGVLVQGWKPDSFMFKELNIVQGECLTSKHRGKRGVLIGKTLAKSLNKNIGDKLTIFETDEFQVFGIYETFNVYENGSLIMLLEDLQRLMGREHKVTGFTIKVNRGTEKDAVERVRREIEALDSNGKIQATPAADFVKSTTQIRAAQAMAWLTSVVALVIGTIGMLNTMVMSVFERTREIGILRAIGWRPLRVMQMILLESILLSVAGGTIGTVAAIALTRFLSSRPAVAGIIQGAVSPRVVLQGFLIALLVGVIGAAYPAYRGARLLPTEAIRHE